MAKLTKTGLPEVCCITFLLIFLLASACDNKPQTVEAAKDAAIKYFEDSMFELDIDTHLFRGPIMALESDSAYNFLWRLVDTSVDTTVIEIMAPKDGEAIKGMNITGSRRDYGYLRGTRQFPLNEAMLSNLFGTAPTPRDISERARRIRIVPLDTSQMKDIANFLEIKTGLMQYSFCFNRSYPDSLEEIREYERNACFMHRLDSLYLRDRYGRKYVYENLIDYVMLGTQGENQRWDFDEAITDSIYNDDREHIYLNGDDIIVKLKPIH